MKNFTTADEAFKNAGQNELVIHTPSIGYQVVSKEFELDRLYYHSNSGEKVFFNLDFEINNLSDAMRYVIKDENVHGENVKWVRGKGAADEISESLKAQWAEGFGIVTGAYYLSGYGNFYEIKSLIKETV